MKGDPTFLILKQPTWLDSTLEPHLLGAIIRYPLRPTDQYLPKKTPPLQYNSSSILSTSFSDFTLSNRTHTSADATLTLKGLGGFQFRGSTQDSVYLAGKLIRYNRLQQTADFWKRLKDDEEVREEVPRWISIMNTMKPCLVTGVMIAEDVESEFKHEVDRNVSMQVTVPGSLGSGVPTQVVPGIGDVEIGGGVSGGSEKGFKATRKSGSIFGLELWTVTTRALRRKEMKIRYGGPKVEEEGRLQGVGEVSDSEDDEEPMADNLILERFTDEGLEQMMADDE